VKKIVGFGSITTGTPSCLSLLSNAVLVWNTVHIAKVLDQLQLTGQKVHEEDLCRVSPLPYAHIIPNGVYFSGIRTGEPDESLLRPAEQGVSIA
jgi:hypothetical protein